jgi:hypothetical protein
MTSSHARVLPSCIGTAPPGLGAFAKAVVSIWYRCPGADRFDDADPQGRGVYRLTGLGEAALQRWPGAGAAAE